jgi:hypothetical protein
MVICKPETSMREKVAGSIFRMVDALNTFNRDHTSATGGSEKSGTHVGRRLGGPKPLVTRVRPAKPSMESSPCASS